jgi:hypothetical protein
LPLSTTTNQLAHNEGRHPHAQPRKAHALEMIISGIAPPTSRCVQNIAGSRASRMWFSEDKIHTQRDHTKKNTTPYCNRQRMRGKVHHKLENLNGDEMETLLSYHHQQFFYWHHVAIRHPKFQCGPK